MTSECRTSVLPNTTCPANPQLAPLRADFSSALEQTPSQQSAIVTASFASVQLAALLKKCEGMPAWGKCLRVFQDVEAFAAEQWLSPAQALWQKKLDANIDWRAAQSQYKIAIQSNDQNSRLQNFSALVKVALQSTSIQDNRTLLSELYQSLGHPEQPSDLPTTTFDNAVKRLQNEQVAAVQWVEERLAANGSALSTDELGVLADGLADMNLSAAARTVYLCASEKALLEQSGQRRGNVALSYWYELKAYTALSVEDRLSERPTLDRIRSNIHMLLARAQPKLVAFDEPVVMHMPAALQGASDSEIAAYPTLVYPATSTATGLTPTGFPQILNMEMAADAETHVLTHDPLVMYVPVDGPETEMIPETFPGTLEQVRIVQELAWQAAYQLNQASEMPVLESELVQRVHNLGTVRNSDEAHLLIGSAKMMATRWTQRGGVLEVGNPQQFRDHLLPLIDQLETAVASHRTTLGNALGQLLWTTHWDGNITIDQPQAALRAATTGSLTHYAQYDSVRNQVARLRVDASWLFDGNAQLDPNTDVSAYAEGERAALRTGSRYWTNDSDLENIGIPLAGTAVGGWLASLVPSAWCGPAAPYCAGAIIFVGGGLAAAGTMTAQRDYTVSQHADALAQSARTGLSVVSESELSERTSQWNTGYYTTMVMGGALGGTGKAVVSASLGFGAWGLRKALPGAISESIEMSTMGAVPTLDLVGNLGRFAQKAGTDFVHSLKHPGSLGRMSVAATGIGADLLTDASYSFNPDWAMNNMFGWTGAALLWNETVGTYILGVNANGQVVSLIMNTTGELGMQYMQDRPLKQPDGQRCFVSNAFSTVATGLVRKPVMLGGQHWGKYAFGREVIKPLSARYPDLAHAFRPVVNRDGAIKRWLSPTIAITEAQYRQILNGVAPKELMTTYAGQFSGKWIAPSKASQFRFTLREPLTAEEFAKLNVQEMDRWVAIGKPSGLHYDLPTGISANKWLAVHKMDADWVWRKGQGSQLGQFRMKHNVDPTTLPVQLQPVVGQWRPVAQGQGEGYVWANPRITPTEFTQYQGLLDAAKVGSWSPQLTVKGMMTNLGPYLGGVLLLNSLAGAKGQGADPYYFPAHRVLDYGFGAVITEPFMKAPLGIDTVKAQLVGYGMALTTRVLLNFAFPTYSQTWMGQDKYSANLDQHDLSGAFVVAQRNMRSLTNPVYPVLDGVLGNNGPVSGTWWRLEHRAIQTFREKHDIMIEALAAHETLGGTVTKNLDRRLHNFTQMVEKQIVQMEHHGADALYDQRFTRVMAAYVKSKVVQSRGRVDPKLKDLPLVLKPFEQMMNRHSAFFAKLPALTDDDHGWETFVKDVNVGQYDSAIKVAN